LAAGWGDAACRAGAAGRAVAGWGGGTAPGAGRLAAGCGAGGRTVPSPVVTRCPPVVPAGGFLSSLSVIESCSPSRS